MKAVKKTAQSGFSLIELSVSLAALALLTWAVSGAYGNGMKQGARDNAIAQGETLREAIRAFALRNRRLPCPDTSGSGWEGDASGVCVGGAETGWMPYRSLGMDIPASPLRAAYSVYRNAAINADLAVATERTGSVAGSASYQDIRDLIGGLAIANGQIPAPGHLYLTGDDGLAGAVDCNNNKVAVPAYVVVLALQDSNGDGSLFDGVHTGLPGNVACFQSQNTPPTAGRDDVVISEGTSALMGWLSAHAS